MQILFNHLSQHTAHPETIPALCPRDAIILKGREGNDISMQSKPEQLHYPRRDLGELTDHPHLTTTTTPSIAEKHKTPTYFQGDGDFVLPLIISPQNFGKIHIFIMLTCNQTPIKWKKKGGESSSLHFLAEKHLGFWKPLPSQRENSSPPLTTKWSLKPQV